MLTRWLTFTAFLSGSVTPERAAVTVAPACRVEGHPEAELTLSCGDGTNAGVVQYWHTPFGDLHSSGFHSKLDPVFMQEDGSLVVPNASVLHSGLYYCLLQHTEGTALWPYKLHISPDTQKNQEHSGHERHSSCGAFRCRRDVGSEAERQGGVSDGQFAGAVTASVLLTFVLGFSAGALSRTHVLRCLGAVTMRLRSPRRRRQTDTPDHASQVTMTTPPSMYNNQVFEMEQTESPISSTASSLPAKPQRSFRTKRQEEHEVAAYLEGCDHMKEEETRTEEEAERRSLEDAKKGRDGETAEDEAERKFYLLEDEGSQTETDEDKFSEGGGDRDESETREETKEWSQEVEEAAEEESESKEGGEGRRKREEEEGNREKRGDDGDNMKREEDAETDTYSKDDETDSKKQEDTMESGNAEGDGDLQAASPMPRPRRRSRIIRLYQYDDEGQRYGHLPDPVPDEPGPAPRLKHRTVSLTRLNAIMDAASAGPLDSREAVGEERLHFHMDI